MFKKKNSSFVANLTIDRAVIFIISFDNHLKYDVEKKAAFTTKIARSYPMWKVKILMQRIKNSRRFEVSTKFIGNLYWTLKFLIWMHPALNFPGNFLVSISVEGNNPHGRRFHYDFQFSRLELNTIFLDGEYNVKSICSPPKK